MIVLENQKEEITASLIRNLLKSKKPLLLKKEENRLKEISTICIF